jgi:hypothetical protein
VELPAGPFAGSVKLGLPHDDMDRAFSILSKEAAASAERVITTIFIVKENVDKIVDSKLQYPRWLR